ncbi:MAG: hypothetical protein GMKNLPBB_02181 [Myxococcota bacterium]|nr:hypothetical protein [Myxococcota bacterium]
MNRLSGFMFAFAALCLAAGCSRETPSQITDASTAGDSGASVPAPSMPPAEADFSIPAGAGEPGCEAADPAQPEKARCNTGAGAFGFWHSGANGLPAYAYNFDDLGDPRAEWTLSDGSKRRDHWFQFGNDHVIAIADNRGFIQLFTRERGPVFWNKINMENQRTGGGYSYIRSENGTWASARGLAIPGAEIRMSAGSDHVKSETRHDGLMIRRTVFAPRGEHAQLQSEIEIWNLKPERRTIRHVEFWDVNRHPVEMQLARSGKLDKGLPRRGDRERDGVNRLFRIRAKRDGGMRISHVYAGADAKPADIPSPRDFYPRDVFLSRVSPAGVAGKFHTQRAAFFGGGGVSTPSAVGGADDPALLPEGSAQGEPAMLAEETELELPPFGVARLRYAFGILKPDEPMPAAWPDQRQEAADLAWFVFPRASFLTREMAWHAGQLLAASIREDYFGARAAVQGSAYMYLHGLDGAARDFAIFAAPLAYLRPDLSRDLLRTLMRMTYAKDKQISYAVQGFGVLENAEIHFSPSDMDLAFLWALTEYMAATGDQEFLRENNPYWPRGEGRSDTTLGHARAALLHLMDAIGLGANGLIRIGTGDWSDGVTLNAKDRGQAEKIGESIYNSAMALWVLPRAAALVEQDDPALARRAREFAAALGPALEKQWVGEWYRRAWFGPGEPYGDKHLDLEAQVWALIADHPAPERRDALIKSIYERVDKPSPVGATLTKGGDMWHAIAGLLTWGYLRSDFEKAWGHFTRQTLHAYAEANPNQWYGIWSQPDGIGVKGGTWASIVTPMTDWPVMNANAHAMPLLAALRVSGVEPAADGALRIAPPPALGDFSMRTPVLELSRNNNRLAGAIRLQANSLVRIRLAVPAGHEARLDGAAVPAGNGEALLELRTNESRAFAFAVAPAQ